MLIHSTLRNNPHENMTVFISTIVESAKATIPRNSSISGKKALRWWSDGIKCYESPQKSVAPTSKSCI